MNDRQRAFCEHFAECGSAAESARRAGYAAKSARSQGQRLLTHADILDYVRKLQDQAAAPRIATVLQVKATLSAIMNDPEVRNSDRIRAAEALLRAAGAFLHRPDDGDAVAAYGESDGGDVVIYLPKIGCYDGRKVDEDDSEQAPRGEDS